MIGHLYYALGLIFLIFNFFYLSKYNYISKIKEWQQAFIKVSKKNPTEKDTDKPDDLKLLNGLYAIAAIEFFWSLFGILSGSWKVFMILFIIYIISGILRKYIGPFNILSKTIGFITVSLKTAIILLLVINHFHLHLDLFTLLLSYVR
jgi:hypothetical protein